MTVPTATTVSPQAPAAPAAAAVVVEAPKPGTPEHDAAMSKKVDDAAAAAVAAGALETPRPAWLPEKFKTAEDMAKSYAELEKKQGTPAEPAKTVVADPAAVVKAANPLEIPATDKAAVAAVENAGLDMAALQSEFTEHGDLKPETYAKLTEKGIPKPMVDAYINGQKALAAQYDAAAFAAAGDQDSYAKMVTWAKGGIPAVEQAAFNKAVTSGDKATMELAIRSLRSQYEANFGKDPALLGGNNTNTGGETYDSMAQVTADMKKPEYKKDPAFRAAVAAKLDRSDKVGVAVQR